MTLQELMDTHGDVPVLAELMRYLLANGYVDAGSLEALAPYVEFRLSQ